MPVEIKSLSPNDLVLHLNKDVEKIDISKYEDFIYELCGEWDFQKDAIRKTLRYYLTTQYQDSKALFEENYDNNEKMQHFESKDKFVEQLPFPYKKACTIDLATGTGKSWVMYAIARIMLAEGIVDRVLVLCPSKTIKNELYSKFTDFTANSILTESLPQDSIIKVPGIKHSDETIEEGDICIDNVHKTYDHVSSSISDSLEGKGERTLVINDEAHHLLNPLSTDKKASLEWNKFLKEEKYNFKFLLNLSGTPYKGNNYFNDVIYRYSIRDAINNKFVKNIDYLTKDELDKDDWVNRWKAILENHEKSKKQYPKCKKHITIVVTNKISECNKITEEIRNFLEEHTDMDRETVEKKVIPVTSSKQHDEYKEQLKTVDQEQNPVEWIVSVSMLTEGWDVKNVFQIVPHDARAFNSKLLISQVLGRGLRIPLEYFGTEIQPKVTIYNHPAWSNKIDNLVKEVAEISKIISSKVIKDSKYNFDLYKINIKKDTINVKKTDQKEKDISIPKKLGFVTTGKFKKQEFTNIKTKRLTIKETSIEYDTFSIKEATNEIFTMLYIFDMNKGTNISKIVSREYISNLLEKELRAIGEKRVSMQNLQRAKQSFGVLFRSAVGTSKIKDTYQDIEILHTSDIGNSYMSESSFNNNGSLVTCNEYYNNLDDEDKNMIEELNIKLNNNQTTLGDDNESFYVRGRIIKNINLEKYKSPLDITLLNHTPERIFIEEFFSGYSKYVDAWIKSKDKGFYSIPYIHRPGTHSLQKDFNPDFFFKKGNKIIVVEIKSEDDSTIKNKDKLEGAKDYFDKLNQKLNGKQFYDFHFLDPRDYKQFFENKFKKNLVFKSRLHADLESKNRQQLKEGR